MKRDKALEAKVVTAVASWYDLVAKIVPNKMTAIGERDACLVHLRDTFRQNERKTK